MGHVVDESLNRQQGAEKGGDKADGKKARSCWATGYARRMAVMRKSSTGAIVGRQKTAFVHGRFDSSKGSNRVFSTAFGFEEGMIGVAEQVNQSMGVLGISGNPATD
jgi:hypothetical protein